MYIYLHTYMYTHAILTAAKYPLPLKVANLAKMIFIEAYN